MQLALTIDPQRLRMPGRGTVTLLFSNPLAAIDQLLHGSAGLRGWGQSAVPDATLLSISGSDPATKEYRYAVNSMFASTTVSRTAFFSPFRITLDVRLDLGPDPRAPIIRRYFERQADDTVQTLSADGIQARIMASVRQPGAIELVLRRKDSLALSTSQVPALGALDARFAAARDSIFSALAAEVAPDGAADGRDGLWERYVQANLAVGLAERQFARPLRSILTPAQASIVFERSGPLRGRAILMDENEVRRFVRAWRLSPY